IAFVGRQLLGHCRRDVVEHLIRGGFNHMHGTLANSDWRTSGLSLRRFSHREGSRRWGGKYGLTLRDDRLKKLDRRFLRRSADVAGADVVVVRKRTSDFAIQIDALYPVLLDRTLAGYSAGLLRCEVRSLFARQLWR